MKHLIFAILLLFPVAAGAEGTEEKVELKDLAADALEEKLRRVRGLELSGAVTRRNGSKRMCATTDAYNSSGQFIGLTYWEFRFTDDGSEVKSMRDVTGLNSACYSARFKKYKK